VRKGEDKSTLSRSYAEGEDGGQGEQGEQEKEDEMKMIRVSGLELAHGRTWDQSVLMKSRSSDSIFVGFGESGSHSGGF
jgi:hypothetical protein